MERGAWGGSGDFLRAFTTIVNIPRSLTIWTRFPFRVNLQSQALIATHLCHLDRSFCSNVGQQKPVQRASLVILSVLCLLLQLQETSSKQVIKPGPENGGEVDRFARDGGVWQRAGHCWPLLPQKPGGPSPALCQIASRSPNLAPN